MSTQSAASTSFKPVYSAPQVIDQLTKSFSTSGYDIAWEGAEVTYTLSNLSATTGGLEGIGWVAMSAVMQDAAREAFDLWDDVIAIDLTESRGDANAGISLNYSSTTGGSTYATFPGYVWNGGTRAEVEVTDSDIWFADNWWTHDDDGDFFVGGYGILTYVHEIGHALGLSHPGHYNGSADFNANAEYHQDTRQYTVMSYFNAGENGETTNHVNGYVPRYAATPLLHDILALQSLYGADMTTRTGDTVYGFNGNTGRDAFTFSVQDDPIVSIWDAGGIDTIDISGWSTDQTLDLTEGSFSSVGYLTDNLSIAFGAVIENAVGGRGDDVLAGNSAANRLKGGAGVDILSGASGNDVLIGGLGLDFLTGGSGSDTFFFGATDQGATITDFTDQDSVEFATQALASSVFGTIGQSGADTLLDLNGTSITLKGLDSSDLYLSGTRLETGTPSGSPSAATNPNIASIDPARYFSDLRDFDGNDLGNPEGWTLLGMADVHNDSDEEGIYVNSILGRWATLGPDATGTVDFSDYGSGGETRVVGVYMDPLVEAGTVVQGSASDSARRFENDLRIDNLILMEDGDADFDGDGLQQVYFKTVDGTAYLHAHMHADGNIQYANYQSEAQMITYLDNYGFGQETYGDWIVV